MKLKAVSGMMLTLLIVGMLTLALNVQPVKSDWTWTETIYIRADGRVEPNTAPIASADNITYTLTNNIGGDVPLESDAIVVQRNNTIVNGAGYTLQGTGNGTGIDLSYRSNITIKDVRITGFKHGIDLDFSSNNTMTRNNIANNNIGIFLIHSSNNIISGNNVTDNEDYGIWLLNQLNNQTNIFYNNNFINNFVLNWDSNNVWDDGYPSGGNYWSNYACLDLYSGQYQNETGSDGIGDTPYIIKACNIDYYPLMKPYAGPHDIGIRVSISKTVVAEGYNTTVTINVTIINYGEQTETFNFTFQTNTTIQEQTLTLTNRNSTTINHTWNTTDVAYGTWYTINASVTIVPGETDTTDNTSSDGWILVSIPGDVNGDFKVKWQDLFALAGAYNSRSGDPYWNPNCDIDGCGHVGWEDLFILAANYGTEV